jgi:hypothetical protein
VELETRGGIRARVVEENLAKRGFFAEYERLLLTRLDLGCTLSAMRLVIACDGLRRDRVLAWRLEGLRADPPRVLPGERDAAYSRDRPKA